MSSEKNIGEDTAKLIPKSQDKCYC